MVFGGFEGSKIISICAVEFFCLTRRVRLWEFGNLVGEFESSIDLLAAGLIIWPPRRGVCQSPAVL